jgi:serine/threonine protein phosphatase PrpC
MKDKFVYSVDIVHDKGSGRMNEDGFLVDDNNKIYVVTDGCTTRGMFTDDRGRTPGKIATDLCLEAFTKNNELVRSLYEANSLVRNEASRLNIAMAASVAAVSIGENDFGWVQAGDCAIIVTYANGTFKALGDTNNYDAELLRVWSKNGGLENNLIWGLLDEASLNLPDINNTKLAVIDGNLNCELFP